MTKRSPRSNPDQVGLPIDGLVDVPLESDEEIAGKMANDLFRPWYKEFYEGRYTQSTGHITRELKKFILEVVVNGEETLETVRAAMRHIGLAQQVVTGASLQYALARAKRMAQVREEAGAHGDMIDENEFTDFMHGSVDDIDYGATGSDF